MNTALFLSEKQLISCLKGNDRRAFEHFYDLHAAEMFGLIFKIVYDHQIAAEVMENTFLEFWKDIRLFDEKTTVLRWALDIARKRASVEYQSHRIETMFE